MLERSQQLDEAKYGVTNISTLDALERQRDQYDLELSNQEKALLDQMIKHMTAELSDDKPYEKANKISAIWEYIKHRMQRG